MSTNDFARDLGPLGVLIGTWEGIKGDDIAPDNKRGVENNKFREKMVFTPIGRVDNHEQVLYGLRYNTTAWRLGVADPFHEEVGYWLWDAAREQVLRCFLVPRGVSVIAGGTVKVDAKKFHLAAEVGSSTYGICSNKFLDQEFKTTRFELDITIHDQNSFSYAEDTHLLMKGRKDVFHHTDRNTMSRVSGS